MKYAQLTHVQMDTIQITLYGHLSVAMIVYVLTKLLYISTILATIVSVFHGSLGSLANKLILALLHANNIINESNLPKCD